MPVKTLTELLSYPRLTGSPHALGVLPTYSDAEEGWTAGCD